MTLTVHQIASTTQAISSKEAVIKAKSATKQAVKLRPDTLKPLAEQLSRVYSPYYLRVPRRKATPGLYYFKGDEEKQGSRLSQWAHSKRPYQVFNRLDEEIHTHLKRGVVAIRPKPGKRSLAVARPGEDSEDVALQYIAAKQDFFGLASPASQLALDRRKTDKLGMTHLFFQQHHNGIPLWGRQLTAHLDSLGELRSVNCLIQPSSAALASLDSDPILSLSPNDAIAIVKAELEAQGKPYALTDEELEIFKLGPPTAELNYWQKVPLSTIELVWVVEIRPNLADWMRFFVRDKDGQIVNFYSLTSRATPAATTATDGLGKNVTLNTTKIGSTYYMLDSSRDMFVGQTDGQLVDDPLGVIVTWDLNDSDLYYGPVYLYDITSTKNTWSDSIAVSAQKNATLSYEYYLNTHGRNSIDGEGGSIISLIHATYNGRNPWGNAVWNGVCMIYGDGSSIFYPLAWSLDVAAHEMTHGVTDNSAGLEYEFQSGALNESFSDVFGCMIDTTNWLLGEDIVREYFSSGALRDLADPHNGGTAYGDRGWQPAHMSEYVDLPNTEDGDWGGVHVNSGIPNHAAYLIAQAIGRSETEQIYYKALTQYLQRQSDFIDCRLALVQAAEDLFGPGSRPNAVKAAFDQVGIVSGTGTPPPEDIPIITGTQYILVVNDDSFGDESIYRITADWDWGSLEHVSSTQVNTTSGRPIAIDPYGQYLMFVDSEFNMVWIDESGEEAFEGDLEYSSIAISPTGRRVSLTLNREENIIYVLDLEAENDDDVITILTLRHPSTSEGVFEDIVRFADAMVWLDDQFLAYDAFNSTDDDMIDFWEVCVIDVLSGDISPILPPQPRGISVGNPFISPRNSSIMCMDRVNDFTGTAEVISLNLFSGESNVVFENLGDIAFANYSVDGRDMVFSRSNSQTGRRDVWQIPLQADQVTANDPPERKGYDGQLPIWYVEGTPPTESVAFNTTSSSGDESTTTVNIPVSLSESFVNEIEIDYAVIGGNAIGNGVDYTLEDGRLTFSPGATTRYISLTVHDDSLYDPDETIVIRLSRPVNVWLGDKTVHTYTILDEPAVTGIEISGSAQVNEGTGAQYTCTATYDDGRRVDVTSSADWSEDSGYASISSTGYLTTSSAPSDQICKITATFQGKSDTHNVTIKAPSPITVQKCKVKAGKTAGKDSISFAGVMKNITAEDLNGAREIYIAIVSDVDGLVAYHIDNKPLIINHDKVKKGKYSHKDKQKGISFKIDANKDKFSLQIKNANLTGLGSPLTVEIEIGDYSGVGSAGEGVVNGKKPIPIQLMSGYKDTLPPPLKIKAKKGKKPSTDSFSVKGGFSLKDEPGPITSVTLSLGNESLDLTDDAGRVTYKKDKKTSKIKSVAYKTYKGVIPQIKAKFDFVKCSYSISIKKAELEKTSGRTTIGMLIDMTTGSFNKSVEVDLD